MRTLAVFLIVLCCALPVLAADQVPYKATLHSTFVNMTFPTPGADTGRCAVLDAVAPLPEDLGLKWGLITVYAEGNSTLMGHVTDVQSHCMPLPVDPTNTPPPPPGASMPFLLGEATITGANGDSIHGTYFGMVYVTDAGMIIDGQQTTDSGTGRFDGASGVGHAAGFEQPDGSSVNTVIGTMSSPGSLKHK